VILSHLDDLVTSGRVTGYTVEEDTSYLGAQVPTLTYRMYMDGPESHLNMGAFAAAMAELATTMRLSRVQGAVAHEGSIWRSRQLCLTSEFAGQDALDAAVDIVHDRFIAAPAAAPGSWRYPDVRVSGAEPSCTAGVFAHQWPGDCASAVVLTLEPEPPADGGRTHRVHVLQHWLSYLRSCPSYGADPAQSLAFSTP
jgi:hypothetical protein